MLHSYRPVFLVVALLLSIFGALFFPALGAYDSGSAYAPALGISSFFPSDAISMGPGKNVTVIAIVSNGGNAQASGVSLSFGGASCCNISASPASANVPALGSQNFTIAVTGLASGTFDIAVSASSLEGSVSSSRLAISVLNSPTTPITAPAPAGTPTITTPSQNVCATCPAGWLPGENDCTLPCPSGRNCPMSVLRCPPATPQVQCPPPATNSCCARTYPQTGNCVPQDTPDNGLCSKNEYCSEACVCLSNKCSSYKDSDSCGANPQCGWCGGDGKCKQGYEVACQPAGCNGPVVYCTKSCGWSVCPPVSSCVAGKCDGSGGQTVTTNITTTITTTTTATAAAPSGEPSSTELEWGDWRPASAVIAGGDVTMTRDLRVRFKGAGKSVTVGTGWRNYATEMEDAGWTCVGTERVTAGPPESSSLVLTVLNCTRGGVITAVQGGWVAAENGTIDVQRLYADVSGRNTDPVGSYGNVSLSAAACLPSFSCTAPVLDSLAPGDAYSVRLSAEGNAINLFRTKGMLPDGSNYAEMEVRNSLMGSGLTKIAGWLDSDGSIVASNRTLEVMTVGEGSVAITPVSICPQYDVFQVGGQTWKSCEGSSGRFEFIIPALPAGGAVAVRASGLPAEPNSSPAAAPAVESMRVSYSRSEVLQDSAGAITAQPSREPGTAETAHTPEAATTLTTEAAVPEKETTTATTATTTTITTTATVMPFPATVNSYVKTVESLSGIPLSTDPAARKSLGEETAKASSALSVEREIAPSAGKSAVSVRLENKGTETLRNVVVFERIPKSVAQSAGEVMAWRVNGMLRMPDRVVEDDPVLAFVFEAVPAGKVDTIEYEVNKEIKSSGAKDYSAPVVVSYALSEGVKGEETGAFSFFAVFQKWIGGWLFWLLVAFFSVVVAGSYLVYRWIRSKTE